MAITTYGVSPTIGETEWAILHRIEARGQWHEIPDTINDYLATAATGTRLVSVSAGDMVVCGVLVRNSAAASVALDANATSNSRIDLIVLEVDWSGDTDTASTIKFVKGTAAASPVAPALTRVAGTLWQVKLAQVTLAPSAGQLTAAMVAQTTPMRRIEYVTQANINQVTVTASGTQALASVTDRDPGWPYRLKLEAVVGFEHVAAGSGLISGEVNSVVLATARAGSFNDAEAVLLPKVSGSLTGAWAARLTATRGPTMAADLISTPARSGFIVTVKPA